MSCRTSSRVLIVLFVMLVHTWFVSSRIIFYDDSPRLCHNHPRVNIEDCEYGYSTNKCGIFCNSGPLGPCGGFNTSCGNGLNCICGKCLGCSTDTIECVDLMVDNAHRLKCKQLSSHGRYKDVQAAGKTHANMLLVNDDYLATLTRD